jgi:predicted ATPase
MSNSGKRGVQSSSEPAAQTGTFAVRGDYWSLGFGGPTFPLKDLKGLSYIQRLLQHPGEEFHSLDLLSGTTLHAESGPLTSARTEGTDAVGGLGDSGEMLDAQAKQAYKRKLRELNEEFEEERERGNHERAEQLKSDIDFINRELARAVGLGGRDRRAGSASERARLNVKRAITGALQKISEQHASMGELLDRSIKTGSFCSYAPDPQDQVTWQFSTGTPEASRGVASPEPLISPRETSLLRSLSERSAFVGREAESAMLRRFLNQAQGGAGRVVMISGAAGVGKTRIGQEFAIEASQKGFLVRAGSCYDRGDSVPFIPFVEILEEALAQAPSPQAFRDALGSDASEIARLLPQLRRLFPDIPPPLEIPPEQSRRLLFHAAADFLARAARNRPVVLLFDDLQWADEGTSSLLSYLAPLIAQMPVLIVGTYRDSEFDPARPLAKTLDEMTRLHAVERLSLGGLPQNAVAGMLRALSGRETPQKLVSLIYSETEGNPFFVEELYYHLVEQGKLIDSAGEFRRDLKLEDVDIPRSLLLVIGRHLARVSAETQKILGAAAVIGRSFTFALLEASTRIDPDRLLDQIEEGEKAGLIYSSLDYPDARFHFSHELIRQAVISELSAVRRQRLHLDAAAAIERIYSSTLEDHAEDLAHHLWQAGGIADASRTVRCLAMAASQAITRSAGLEAIGYLSKALDRLRSLPETPQRDEQELELQVRLGMTLTFAKGYSSVDVQRAYARARELSHQVGESPQLFRILRGLAGYYSVRAEHKTAFQLAEQCLSLAKRLNDPLLLLGSHMELGATLFCLGNYTEARTHLERAIALHEPQAHRIHSTFHGQDFGVSARARAAHVLWFLGYPGQAYSRNQEALTLAQELAHPFTLAYVHVFAAVLNQFWRNPRAVKEHAEAAIQLGNDQGFPLWAVAGRILRGWALSEQGHSEGIVEMTEGLGSWGSVGPDNTYTHQPYFLALLAEAHGKFGQLERALALLVQMAGAVERTEERSYEAELHRLRGELLLKSPSSRSDSTINEAERCLRQAIAVARGQSAKSLELRAATSLSRLLLGRGKTDEARGLLSEIRRFFTEGFDSKDLKEAEALLAKIR